MVGPEADNYASSIKRFQVTHSKENKSFVVAGADVQPLQQ